MAGRLGKRRRAIGALVLTAALAPACGDEDTNGEPRRAPQDAGRDARSGDAQGDAPDTPDSSPDTGADTGVHDGGYGDATDGGGDGRIPEGLVQDAAGDVSPDAAADAMVPDAGAPDSATLEAGADAAIDAVPQPDSALDSGLDAGSEPDGAPTSLVFWQVGQDFVCEATPVQVECNDDDFAERYVVTILQSAGSSCAQGPSRVTFYFEYGSPPAAGEYTLNALSTFSDPQEAWLQVDVNNGAQTWTAQSGVVAVQWIDGAPSLSFAAVPGRSGATSSTLSGRVTCPPDTARAH